MQQGAGVLLSYRSDQPGVRLVVDRGECFFQGTQAPAVVRAENHPTFTHRVDQKLKGARARACAIHGEMLEQDLGVSLLATRPIVLPPQLVEEKRYAPTRASDNNLQPWIAVE